MTIEILMTLLSRKFSLIKLPSWALAMALLGMSACATQYKVSTYPAGAKVRVENIVTKEVFEMGEGPVTFPFEERFGEGFVLSVEKDTFNPKKVFISRNSGASTNVAVTLEPRKLAPNPEAGPDAKNEDEKKPGEAPKQGDDAEMAKRMAVLERTFEIYKDALFSQRYGTGPAGYDRDKIDTQVSLVTKAQQLIERKDFNAAEDTVKKIIDRDEYLAQGHVLEGTIRYLKGDYADAIRSWERALEINPTERLTRQYLVAAYRKAGKQLPANVDQMEVLDRAPASSPLSPDPLKLRLRSK